MINTRTYILIILIIENSTVSTYIGITILVLAIGHSFHFASSLCKCITNIVVQLVRAV